MHETEALTEAARLMTICNACRYCEGLCAVFPAMEMRREFSDGDLNFLANLCHGCGACYIDCQFSPPHEFNVNVPRVLARVRAESYAAYAWPSALSGLFRGNGRTIGIALAASVASFVLAFYALAGGRDLFTPHAGSGAFYWLMPHNAMAGLFGAAFLAACLALAAGLMKFGGEPRAPLDERLSAASVAEATRDAARLRYLEGGGPGCYNAESGPDRRRIFHHLTFYGFLLCLASTSVATFYHYVLGREAPCAWTDPPVVLGVLGGIGLLAGPLGLLWEKRGRDPMIAGGDDSGMGTAFIVTLFLTSVTGLALLLFRHTSAMNLLLAIHLGVVFAFFVTLPYGKFVHGLYRYAALIRYEREKRALLRGAESEAQ